MKKPLEPPAHVPALVEQLGDKSYVLDDLSARECRFVEEYLVDLNAAGAARRAGYGDAGAKTQGYALLRRPKVVDAITAVMATRSHNTAVNRSWVLSQLVDAHVVAKSKESAAHLASRLKALELIGRHVDVRAFRAGIGFGGGEDDDGRELWDLSRLDEEEFDTFERLLAKVTVIKPFEGGAGGAPAPEGSSADSGRP